MILSLLALMAGCNKPCETEPKIFAGEKESVCVKEEPTTPVNESKFENVSSKTTLDSVVQSTSRTYKKEFHWPAEKF